MSLGLFPIGLNAWPLLPFPRIPARTRGDDKFYKPVRVHAVYRHDLFEARGQDGVWNLVVGGGLGYAMGGVLKSHDDQSWKDNKQFLSA